MTLLLRGEVWHYDFIIAGVRYRGTTGFVKNEKKKARQAEDDLKAKIRGKANITLAWEQTKRQLADATDIPPTEEALWPLFVERTLTRAGERRLAFYRLHVRRLCEWINANRTIKTIAQFSGDDAMAYIQQMRARPGAAATKNAELQTMRMLFGALADSNAVAENPFLKIDKLPASQEDREAFSAEELQLIGSQAEGWIKQLLTTCLSTGMREEDACLLEWTSIDLDRGWLHVPHARKTGKPIDLPLMPGLRALIDEQPREGTYVYPELAQMYQSPARNRIGAQVKTFFGKIGIDGTQKDVAGYRRKVSIKDVHSFRHTFVFLAALAGWPLPVVQAAVQHSDPKMTAVYMDHVKDADKERYFAMLPDYFSGEASPSPDRMAAVTAMIDALHPSPEAREELLGAIRQLAGL